MEDLQQMLGHAQSFLIAAAKATGHQNIAAFSLAMIGGSLDSDLRKDQSVLYAVLIGDVAPCRLNAYKQFKEGQKRLLVATDLIGRGIDIERVNIVINYDMPETDERHGNGADTYLHRVRFLCHAFIKISSITF